MAEAAAQAQLQQQPARLATATSSDVVFARLQQVLALLFPSNLAAKAALFALVVALLPLLPTSQASKIWELPHLLLLGIIISYGVFGQKNADAEVAAAAAVAADAKPVDDEASVEAYVSQIMQGSPLVFEENDRDGDCGSGAAGKDGLQAWSSQYLPDDPLVVVADTNTGDGNAGEKPLLLPVRKLKPGGEESETLTDTISDSIEAEEEEEEFIAAKAAGYDGVRERAIPSPSSVLDADLTLCPSSPPLLSPPAPPPPPPPPFLGRGRHGLRKAKKARSFNEFGNRSMNERLGLHGGVDGKHQFRSRSAVQATGRAFAGGYEPVVPLDDGEDAVDDDADLDDEMVAASESSFSSDDMGTDGDDDKEENIFEEDEEEEEEDGNSCDEELFELARRQGPEIEDEEGVEDEVDRKADEFIAKFREQIRMQRLEPATTRR
ncbi:hypothetical protein HU200_042515 [Digitaria exilis]|uniref:Uncharacterized protein n=1 Tax=Digitaria exilis TaxID=1010633 RepID=A0A835B4W3_9POAL|nr:hypothetical protein HU200_042515 [Digitaria exilis]